MREDALISNLLGILAVQIAREMTLGAALYQQLSEWPTRRPFVRLPWVRAVIRRRFPVGASPHPATLQPEAAGAAMEVTK
jgi:hypothetical protein